METFLQGWVVGFIIASPIGPVGVLCIRRTLTGSRLVGLFTVLGAATADAIYGLVAGLGLTAVSHALMAHRTPLRLVAGFFLLFIGVRLLMMAAPDEARTANRRSRTRTLPAAYFSTLVLMLANPFIILSFLAVFAALGLHETGISELAAGWLFTGIFLGSAAWWIIFRLAAGWLRSHIEKGGLRVVNLAAGALICGFGLWQFVDLVRHR
jgi:threonine/homoserine/homoserine lactone efflux protein